MYIKLLSTIFNTTVTGLEVIPGGTTDAKNYRFEVGKKIWLLRIFNPEHSPAERQQEGLISELVGVHGISGKVIYKDSDCLVREYLPGKPLTYADLHDRSVLKTIIELLKIQHQIPTTNILAAPLCQARIEHHLNNAGMPELFNQLNICFNFPETTNLPALIHNDLHHANILLHQQQVQFIDWSLAGLGDVFSDLAEVAIYVDSDLRHYILQCYFGNIKYATELQHACQARLLLFTAWALSMAKTTINIEMLKKPKTDFNSWISALTNNERQLNSSDNFIDFAASCVEKFHLKNIKYN